MSDYFKQELSDFKSSSKKLRKDLLNYFRGIQFGSDTLYDPSKWDSLVHYWPLDEDADDDVGSTNFTVEGSPNTSTGVANGAYAFDASDDRLINTDFNFTSTGFSVSVWFDFASLSQMNLAINSYDGSDTTLAIAYRTDTDSIVATFETNTDAPTLDSGITPAIDTKYHGVLTYDGSTGRFYVNNTEEFSTSVGGDLDYPSEELSLGYFLEQGTYGHFNYIDEPMIFNKALNSTEIDTLYQKGA